MRIAIVAVFLLLSAGSVALVLFNPRFSPIRWPVAAFLGAWTATTGLSAAYVLLPGGIEALKRFLAWLSPEIGPVAGSLDYAALLLLPYVIVPLAALAGQSATTFVMSPAIRTLRQIDVSRNALLAVMALAVGYCLFKLHQTGHLVPHTLFSSDNYEDKIRARVEMMAELRFTFYAVFYAVIPMLAVLFLARFLDGHRSVDLAGFVFGYVFFVYLTAATYLKAPVLYLLILLAVAVLVARMTLIRRIAYFAGLALLAWATFVSLQVLMGGVMEQPKAVAAAQPLPPKPKAVQPAPKTVPSKEVPIVDQYQAAAWRTAEAMVFRMGSSFPYYVAAFDDPKERCGIETNKIPLLPAPRCMIPTKIHAMMYPKVHFVTGFALAAAHVSAFGEVGLWYAVVVMVFSGLSLGVIGSIAQHTQGTVSTGLQAAGVIYAYFLTQVPFIGALTYAHGLVFYLFPIVLSAAPSGASKFFARKSMTALA
jgi:hypothetical protein